MIVALNVVLGVSIAAALFGCGKKVEAPSTTNVLNVPLTSARGMNVTLNITEVCIEGIVYLVTETGGITPKMVPDGNPLNDDSSRALVKRCQ